MGIDTVTYFPAHLVYIYGASWDEAEKLSRPAPILKHFRMGPGEIRSWSHTKWGTPPTDLEQSRGPNAEVHIQTEMPEAVRATLEREAIAAEARRALKLLLQIPEDEWTDTQMRAIILNIAKSDLMGQFASYGLLFSLCLTAVYSGERALTTGAHRRAAGEERPD
jgi:hypothetical protein